MSSNDQTPRTSVGRRTVLRAGAAGLGAAAAMWATAGTAVAAPRTALRRAPVLVTALGDTVGVLGPTGDVTALPRTLGATLRPRAHVPRGAQVTVSWDARTHVAGVGSGTGDGWTLSRGGDIVESATATPTTDPATGITTLTATLSSALDPHDVYELSCGIHQPRRYPEDLVAEPAPVRVVVVDHTGQALADAALGTERVPGELPWGGALGVIWEEVTWDERFRTVYPSALTVRSVGPGPLPAGYGVRVLLDAQVVEADVVVVVVDGNGDEVAGTTSTTAEGGLVMTTWSATGPLAAGGHVTVRLPYRTREIRGSLAWLEPPLVQLTTSGTATPARRLTGLESMTRDDSVHALATTAGG